ncbi:MAG: PsbP-related protein, partial [Dehalococcoidia bacterium]
VIGIAIVVILGGALLLIGSFTSSPEPDTEDASSSVSAYSNSEYEFYLNYPKDWSEMPESIIGLEADIVTGVWAPSEEYGITTNVLVAREKLPEGMDIDTYFELAQQSFAEGPPVTISKDRITVDDIPGIKWTYRSPSAESVTQMHVSFIRENTAWVLIFTCAEQAFDANKAIFDLIIDSYRFTDDGPKVILSTASLSEATMTETVDDNLRPLNSTDVFNVDASEVHCSVKLSNAPVDTEVKGEWIYIEGEEEGLENYLIDSTIIITEGTRYLDFSLSIPDNGWPVGNYELILSINGKEKIRVPFLIKKLNIV